MTAGWTHDLVYVPGATDNEVRSADAAILVINDRIDRPLVRSLIMATRAHWPSDSIPHQIICDADLAILSSDWEDYLAYVAAIRAEYAAYDERDWTRGRAAWIKGMLAYRVIYQRRTDREAAARSNLARELAALGARHYVNP